MVSQITSLTIVYSTVCSSADQRKHKNSASLAFVWGIHRSPVNSPHRGPVTRKSYHLMTSSWYTNHSSSCWQTFTCQELVWLWRCVGWYDTVILSCLVWNVYFNRIVQNSLHRDMDIGNMWCPSVHKFHIYSELNENLCYLLGSPQSMLSEMFSEEVAWKTCPGGLQDTVINYQRNHWNICLHVGYRSLYIREEYEPIKTTFLRTSARSVVS